jgi:hypothetical protein
MISDCWKKNVDSDNPLSQFRSTLHSFLESGDMPNVALEYIS